MLLLLAQSMRADLYFDQSPSSYFALYYVILTTVITTEEQTVAHKPWVLHGHINGGAYIRGGL